MTEHGPWRILGSREVYRDAWIALRRDEVIRPDGLPGHHCVLDLKPGVCVLAVDDQRNVQLTDEFHYAVGRHSLEAVSGGCDPGEMPVDTATRELAEELGIVAAEFIPLGSVDPFTTIVASPTALFLARSLTFVAAAPEGTEQIARVQMPLADALAGVLDGRITHAPTCVAVLKAARLLGA
jgi:ADP-ribose pyrophosphatase